MIPIVARLSINVTSGAALRDAVVITYYCFLITAVTPGDGGLSRYSLRLKLFNLYCNYNIYFRRVQYYFKRYVPIWSPRG